MNYDEKHIVIVDFVDGVYNAFDGENDFVMSKQEYDDARYKYMSSPYQVVNKDFSGETKNLSIEDAHYYYIEMADQLKEASKGKFNLYKCPTIKNMALNHFYDLTKAIQPEDINNNEAYWINMASSHAITFYEKYKGDIHVYDINSRYPHIMQKNTSTFPIKSGIFQTVKEIEINKYGIYRCKITATDNKPYKFFVYNKSNYYSHLDVEVAQTYGLNVELICDGKPNFLYYPKENLINGSILFKKYVDELYKLKQDKIKGSKLLLNILWGALVEKKLYKETGNFSDAIDLSGRNITRLQTDTHVRVHYTKHEDSQFRTNYGRIKAFVLAFARKAMFYSFRKWEPLIKRIHTDSLYLTEIPCDILPSSNKLGCLKHEYSGQIEILGLNKVVKNL